MCHDVTEIYLCCKNAPKSLVNTKRGRKRLQTAGSSQVTPKQDRYNFFFWTEVKKTRCCSSSSRTDKIKSKGSGILS